MKNLFVFFLILSSLSLAETFSVKMINPIHLPRNEVVEVPFQFLIKNFPQFNFNSFGVIDNGVEVPFEIINDPSSDKKLLLIYLNFEPNESKKLIFNDNRNYEIKKITQSFLGIKKNFIQNDGFYSGGNFESVKSVKVPKDHFAHDALYQFEGPGWESDKVGYRLYLDDRNRIDIFGKKTDELVLDKIGKNDLISDGNESYQRMQYWGQDVFKVGNSLGIGTTAYYKDSVITISETDSIFCTIYDNNLLSGVETNYFGWKINNQKNNIKSVYSIFAGSRFSKANVFINAAIDNICTGLAKHDHTEFIKGENSDWGYIALWGKQTLSNDNLGISVVYKKSNFIELKEDDINYIVLLKPENSELNYYFGAAWEQEKNDVESLDDFRLYLNNEIDKLSNPIKMILK